jgi:amidase
MHRRSFIEYAAGAAAAVAAWRSPPVARPQAFELDEATIAALQEGMRSGRYTSRSLCEAYLARIDAVDRAGPALRAVLETNPDALAIADRLDADAKRDARAGHCTGSPCSSRTTSRPPTG